MSCRDVVRLHTFLTLPRALRRAGVAGPRRRRNGSSHLGIASRPTPSRSVQWPICSVARHVADNSLHCCTVQQEQGKQVSDQNDGRCMTRTRRQRSRRDKQVCSGCYHQPLCLSPLDGARGGVAVAPLGFLLIEAEPVQYRCRVPNQRHEWMRVGNVTEGGDAVRGDPGVVVNVQSPWACP